MSTKVVGDGVAISVTPVIGTSAYQDQGQFGGIMALTGAARQKYSISTLVSVTLADKSKQMNPMTLFFFNEFPNVSSVNGGLLNVPDSEMASKCIGHVSFTSGDYAAVSGSSLAVLRLPSSALVMKSLAEQGTIYAVAKINVAGAVYAVGDVLFRYLFNRDA